MKSHLYMFLYMFLLGPLAVCAALAQDTPEVESHQSPATFSSRVNLVSVPVVVRDTKGRAVGNLRQEDFRLFDKGRQQVIISFSVQANGTRDHKSPDAIGNPENAGQPGPTANTTDRPVLPNRYVAYVFDDIHLNFGQLAEMRAATERHVAESLAPNSRAAVYTTSGRIWLDFTNDSEKLHQTLLQLKPGPNAMPPSKSNDDLTKADTCPPDVSYYQSDQVLNYQNPDATQAAEAAAVACYGPDPHPPSLGLMVSNQVLSAGNLDTQNSLISLADLVRRLSAMPGSRSIVLISPGFFVTRDFTQAETALIDSSIRSNVTLNGLDARGLYTRNTPDNAARGDSMREMAFGTGGRFFENDNGFKEGLNLLAATPEYTYVLGFSPQNLKFDGAYHALKITLSNSKGLELQARRGYWAPNHAADPEEQAKEEIREAVFSLEEVREIPLEVTTEFFKLDDTTAEVTVDVHLDLNGLRFRTAGDRKQETLTVVTGLFDQNGHYVRGVQRVIDLRLRDQTLEKLLGPGMAVKENFDIPVGRYVVRVVVRDSEGQSMAARNGTVDLQ